MALPWGGLLLRLSAAGRSRDGAVLTAGKEITPGSLVLGGTGPLWER